jgi:hypothetical protein
MLEHLDDELGRQLWQQRRWALLNARLSRGPGGSGTGEESSIELERSVSEYPLGPKLPQLARG